MGQNFRRGSIVKILSANKYNYRKGRYKHEKDLVGNIGTVIAESPDYITVEVNGMKNPTSQTGFYFFDRGELEIVSGCHETRYIYEEGENQMDYLNDCRNIAEVYLYNDPSRVFLCANYSPDLSIGDCAVITAPNGVNVSVAVVSQLHECDSEDIVAMKANVRSEIVCRCNMDEFTKRLNLRADKAKKEAERRKLLNRMAEQADRVDQMHRYRILAEHDEEMSELLRQFDALDNPGEIYGTEEA